MSNIAVVLQADNYLSTIYRNTDRHRLEDCRLRETGQTITPTHAINYSQLRMRGHFTAL